MININLNCQVDGVKEELKRQNLLIMKLFKELNMKVSEIGGVLKGVSEGVDNIEQDIAQLKAALEDMDLPSDAEEALNSLVARVNQVKDIVQ